MRQPAWTTADLEAFVPDEAASRLISRAVAARYGLAPLSVEDKSITLGMKDPKDLEALDYVQMVTGLKPRAVAVEDAQIRELIDRIYGAADGPAAVSEESVEALAAQATRNMKVEADGTVEMPVVRLFDRLMSEAVRAGATDVHVQPQEDELQISFRVDGIMRETHRLPAEIALPLATRIKVVASLDISERRLPQDGKISVFLAGKNVDLRISTMPTVHGENVVIRVLQQGKIRLGLEDLGFRPDDMARLRDIFGRPHGIVLVTGPTGSGKTTTLYAALREVDTSTLNVMTLEDPVEYRLPRIRQSQIHERAGMTFARGLRAILRQDPDVILVGEMRDKETAEIAVRAALTGHLVLSTLHTNSAIGTLTRLRNMGTEPFLVSATLAGVISQRLARRVCPHCREERAATEAEKALLRIESNEPVSVWEGKGCPQCGGFGMKGRIVVYEFLAIDETLSEAIARDADAGEIRRLAEQNGFTALREHATQLVLRGEIPVSAMTRIVA
ncbi:MAG: GspE/PulE family protein [bacterium]